MKNSDTCSSIFWIVLSGTAMGLAFRLPLGNLNEPGPGLFPMLVSLVILGLAFILLFRNVFMARQVKGVPIQGPKSTVKLLLVLALLALYAVFLETAGFLIVTFLLILLLLWVVYPQKLWIRLVAALAGSFGSYLIFQVWLESQLPRGILGF